MAKRPRIVTDEEVLSRASHLIASAVLEAWATGSMDPEGFKVFQEDARRGLSAISHILSTLEPSAVPVAEEVEVPFAVPAEAESYEPPEGRHTGVTPEELSELFVTADPETPPAPEPPPGPSASEEAEACLAALLSKYNIT